MAQEIDDAITAHIANKHTLTDAQKQAIIATSMGEHEATQHTTVPEYSLETNYETVCKELVNLVEESSNQKKAIDAICEIAAKFWKENQSLKKELRFRQAEPYFENSEPYNPLKWGFYPYEDRSIPDSQEEQ